MALPVDRIRSLEHPGFHCTDPAAHNLIHDEFHSASLKRLAWGRDSAQFAVNETSKRLACFFGQSRACDLVHIIKVEERDESRELDPAVWEQRKQGVLENWLAGRRYSDDVERLEDLGATELPLEVPG